MADRKEKLIIIGGGIAGLSAGIYALKAGYEQKSSKRIP
jgi:thioredoxin reductase